MVKDVPESTDHMIAVPEGDETDWLSDLFRASVAEETIPSTDPQTDDLPPADAPVLEDQSQPQDTENEPELDPVDVEPEAILPEADPSRYVGTDGDDAVLLIPGLQAVDGGNGTDSLLVPGYSTDYQISFTENDTVQFEPVFSDLPVEVQNVERISFYDGNIAFDTEGLAGQAYRLYQACFDRIPDAEGLGFWIKQLDAGNVTLTEAADHFLASEEFASVYGNPDELADVHYLALLYANVLNRVPDQEGFAFWRAQQENGITRADMLVYFSESAENKALVADAIDDGIWYF